MPVGRAGMKAFAVLVFVLVLGAGRAAEDKDRCPRPDEIAPCQCRTRGPTIQVKCSNSMIGRITDAMMSLRRLVPSVDVLILEDNHIPHLPSRALGSVPVNRLFLEGNRLASVDRNAFAGVEDHLTEIYIKEPSLSVLPEDSMDFLYRLTVLSVENSRISELPRLAGLRRLKLLRVDGSHVRSLSSGALSDLPALKYLHLAQSRLERLDIGVLEELTQLVLANFTGNELSWIHPRAFRYMEQMQEVSLRGNKLRDAAMVGRAMRVVKTLRRLDLSHNEIDELRQGSFIDVISLEELDMSHNKLTRLQRTSLHRLPRLRAVDLSHNAISAFHSDAFKETPLVETLHLSHNALMRVADVSFLMDALPKLALLDLSNNDITGIPFGALRGYPGLRRLLLGQNQISEISRRALADLPSLTELDLSGNKLIADALEGPIFDLTHLKSLNLSHNKLSRLDAHILSSLTDLRYLDVSYNSIAAMEEDALRQTTRLTALNISNNNIRELKARVFSGLTNLQLLDASYNELVTLPDLLLRDQSRLQTVSFAHNQIQQLSVRLLPERSDIQELDFTGNFVRDFPERLVSRLPGLRRLSFRKNSIRALERLSFRGLRKLESLDLHDNRIQTVEEDAFRDLTSLKSLDLSLNVIGSVGDSLEPLVSLMKLNLSDNYLTSLPRNAFHALHRLSTLDVSNNTIVDVGSAFVDMPELKYLDLSHNHLPVVKEGAFKALPELISLHLDHNSVTEIQAGAFQDLQSLEKLALGRNGVSKIERSSFVSLPSLSELWLDDNLITELEDRAFVDLYSLKELHLEHNLIEEINERAFVRVPSLRYLNMSFNLVKSLPRSGFDGVETLETIDLSFNDLREVDERAFDSLRWLADLRLNDNNICLIRSTAFGRSPSLSSLRLSNNRLTTIREDAFGEEAKQRIRSLQIAGNPLTCDCDTLWLRNWASASGGAVLDDEPRCYFPQALSGNPLIKLRTSRFTCDDNRNRRRGGGSSRRRAGGIIPDACSGVPLKTPVQASLQIEEQTPIYPYPDPGTEANVVIQEQLDEDSVSVAADTTDAAASDGDGDVEYEYYYVYYDEDGNVVANGSGGSAVANLVNASSDASAPAEKVTQKIHDIPVAKPAVTAAVEKPGDTPTIYAEIKNPNSEAEKADEATQDQDQGLTIFGIPIPKIPISLSFGLAPALSTGLLPLPSIGRKGDSIGGPDETVNTNSYHKQLKPQKSSHSSDEITRGPDALDPVWVETGLKAASSLLPQLANVFSGGKDSSESEKSEEASSTRDQDEDAYKQKIYNYEHPVNPVIPLNKDRRQNQGQHGEIRRKGEYYPKGFLPAIKFDHPIPLEIGISGETVHRPGPLLARYPVFPPPAEKAPEKHQHYHNYQNAKEKGGGSYVGNGGSPRDSVNGFIPLFRPHSQDPNYKAAQKQHEQPRQQQQQASAFPGIDATLNLPPGFRTPTQLSSNDRLYPPPVVMEKQPSIKFSSPSSTSDIEEGTTMSSTTSVAINAVGIPIDAVPSGDSPMPVLSRPNDQQQDVDKDRPGLLSSLPSITNLFHSRDPDEAVTDDSSTAEYNYDYYYSGGEQESKPKEYEESNDNNGDILEFLKELGQKQQEFTSERTVPTLHVEEVIPTTTSKSTTSTTEKEIPLTTTTAEIEIAHRGTPKEVTAIDKGDDDEGKGSGQDDADEAELSTEGEVEETTLVSVTDDDSAKNKPEYEYHYEYYYDEDEEEATTTVSSTTSATSDSPHADEAFQNLLELMQQPPPHSLLRPNDGGVPLRTPTPTPNHGVFPSSTRLYDLNGNYLESQRSNSISRAQKHRQPLDEGALRSSSVLSTPVASSTDSGLHLLQQSATSSYPFHPDRLDPARRPPEASRENSSLHWYYNGYDHGESRRREQEPLSHPKNDPSVASSSTRSSLERGEALALGLLLASSIVQRSLLSRI